MTSFRSIGYHWGEIENMIKCYKCNDTGYTIIGPLGLRVKCSCQIESSVKEQKLDRPIYHVTQADKIITEVRGLVPTQRINDEYDEDTLTDNIANMCRVQRCKIKGFNNYSEALNTIIAKISTGTLNQSYILGAPNGFGKATFANTCIKRLDSLGLKAVPYISLFEIAELRVEHEKRLLGYLNKTSKVNDDSDEEIDYTWTDYVKTDALFTYLTTLENKKVETAVLKAIMEIRGPKDLPTIVFTSSSLKPYLSDITQKKVIWDDILAYNDDKAGCDRLIHKSCFKIYDTRLDLK